MDATAFLGSGSLAIIVFLLLIENSLGGSICKKTESSMCLSDSFQKSVHTNRSYAYEFQRLKHCTKENYSDKYCAPYWNAQRKQYTMRVKEHYERLIKFQNHSLNLMNKQTNAASKIESRKRLLIDVVIDARCHHSWPYNPYHRFADCLIFILPALNNYLEYAWMSKPSPGKRKVALLVDESTEMLCEYLNLKTDFEGNEVKLKSDDFCLLSNFQSMLRTKYYYQCIKISIFHKTIYWYKLKHRISVLSNELIWLEEQRNPLTGASGFMNEMHPAYSHYIKDFRKIMFDGFCFFCELPFTSPMYDVLQSSRLHGLDAGDEELPEENDDSLSNNGHHTGRKSDATGSGNNRVIVPKHSGTPESDVIVVGGGVVASVSAVSTQTTVLVLRRKDGTGRDIPQHDELLDEIRHQIVAAERYFATHGDHDHKSFHLIEYTGNESTCETMAMYWSSKVVIAAHGAGIVNTIFSRPNSLLIEISPDKIEPESKGVPWRMNSPFARSVGVSTHVIVVPHNESAKNNGEIQKLYPMSLNRSHIDFVGKVLYDYLIAPRPQSYVTSSKITSLVD